MQGLGKVAGFGLLALLLACATTAQATVRFETRAMSSQDWDYPVAGDFNGDGWADLATGFEIWMREPGAFFGPKAYWTDVGGASYPATAFDVGTDGSTDLAFIDSVYDASTTRTTLRQRFARGKGNGTFDPVYTGGTWLDHEYLHQHVVADLNRDGYTNLVMLAATKPGGAPRIIGGDSGVVVPTTPMTTPSDIGVGDFNGDGRLDIVVPSANGLHYFHRNARAAGYEQSIVGTLTAPREAAVGDFTGDGKDDVAVVNGTSLWTRSSTGVVQTYASPASTGVEFTDVNGDGWPDLVVLHQSSGTGLPGSVTVRINSAGTLGAPISVPMNNNSTYELHSTQRPDGRLDALIAMDYWNVNFMLNRSTASGAFSPSKPVLASTAPGTEGAPMMIAFINTGHDTIKLSRIDVFGLNAADFELVADGCTGVTLKANERCRVTVRLRPGTAGAKTAYLRALHDGDNGSSQVTMTGTAQEPAAPRATAEAPAAADGVTVVVNTPPGPAGPKGDPGPQGEPGRDGVLRCAGSDHECTLNFAATSKPRTVRAELRRGKRVVARAKGRTGRRAVALKLRGNKRLKPGRYELRLVKIAKNGRRTVIRRTVRI